MRGKRLRELCQLVSSAKDVSGRSIQKRYLHQRKNLSNLDLEKGLPPLLSSDALRMLAVDFQEGLLDRLNDLVRGTPWETSSLPQTVIQAAQDRTHILAFNLASEALNNAYFLSRLTSDPEQHTQFTNAKDSIGETTSLPLFSSLANDFASLTSFQDAFSSAALGMSGSGYIWLVMDQTQKLGIVGTYGAGTVLVQDRQQRGDMDPDVEGFQLISPQQASAAAAEASASTLDAAQATSPLTPHSARPTLGSTSSKPVGQQHSPTSPSAAYSPEFVAMMRNLNRNAFTPEERANKANLEPLLCLSVHERAWIKDYGIWGKEAYLANFWKAINWTRVNATFEKLGGARATPRMGVYSHIDAFTN